MAVARVMTRALNGVDALEVSVEIHLSSGLPAFNIVGLPELAVKEARERVRSALVNSGFDFPRKRITVNLAPADLPKQGGRYDLAIAVGLLCASQQIPDHLLSDLEFLGELSLDGNLRTVGGHLAAAIACGQSQRSLITAASNSDPASLSKTTIYHASTLKDVALHLAKRSTLPQPQRPTLRSVTVEQSLDQVVGQASAKRALSIAACGRHHLLLYGPPGSGKTMLAKCLPELMPACSYEESLEVQKVYNACAKTFAFGKRPFRRPHHSSSSAALVGGSNPPKPGEITLAHRGVLFLDELAEFPRHILDQLREPLETRSIHISRSGNKVTFPADFQLIAATNPCPCGYSPLAECRCSANEVLKYQARLSGPFMDRFDLSILVNPVPFSELINTPAVPSSQVIDIKAVQQIQLERQGVLNSELDNKALTQQAALSPDLKQLLANVCDQNKWSMRSWSKILKVARTIADIDSKVDIERPHLLEAVHFRQSIYQGSKHTDKLVIN